MADLPVRRGSSTSIQRAGEWDPFQQMQELMSWDPFEMMNQWLSNVGRPLLTGVGRPLLTAYAPAFEVRETKDAFIFKADLPGVEEKDLDISFTGDRIVVSGKREREEREESDRFYAYERSYGTFSRAFTLPEGVDTDNVKADLKNGVLTLRLPKRPEVQPKRIKVTTAEKKEQAKA